MKHSLSLRKFLIMKTKKRLAGKKRLTIPCFNVAKCAAGSGGFTKFSGSIWALLMFATNVKKTCMPE